MRHLLLSTMAMLKIEMHDGDLSIMIKGDEGEQNLYGRALAHLIKEAPIHTWEKQAIEDGADPRVLEHFCADVLAALALSYRCDADLYKSDDDPTRDVPRPLGSVLAEIIGRLEEAEMLDREVPAPGGDIDLADYLDDYDDDKDPDDDDQSG